MNAKLGNVGMIQRGQNEQRWKGKIANDEFTDELRFTKRVRYLMFFNIPIFNKKKTGPLLVVSNEILIHFGEEVI